MKILPFGNNILVKPAEKKQALGPKSLCEYGTVTAVGSEVKIIKVGDMIGYFIWGVKDLEIENEKFHFVPETDEFVLGKIEMLGELAS